MKAAIPRRNPGQWLAAICLALLPLAASAHDARPVVVALTEQLPGVFQFVIRVPDTVDAANQPGVVWPEGCTEQSSQAGVGMSSGSVVCENGLFGRTLSLAFPFYNPSLATYYRLDTLDGASMTVMLSPTRGPWEIPAEPTPGNVAMQYLSLGVEHIIGGPDHLLFVLGLLVIAGTLRRILWTITGFTIAHSITLSLSALGFVNMPVPPVEAAIALSILFLAYEISRDHRGSLTYRFPLLVSFTFGLLHGLGFASALGEIGLVKNEVVISLLFFNIGVEVGQVAFILAVIVTLWRLRALVRHRQVLLDALSPGRLEYASSYLIGIPASYWLIDRVVQFLV